MQMEKLNNKNKQRIEKTKNKLNANKRMKLKK